MHSRSLVLAGKAFVLGALGALLGLFGISAYTDTSFANTISAIAAAEPASIGAIANACTPESEYDEIYFLSCGGIY